MNVIHRDIKLGNLLLDNDNLKIGDFGLSAKLTDGNIYKKLNNILDRPERDTLCGTPNYISP